MIFLFSCRMADPTTLVDELRIMGIRTNPAEISTEELFIPSQTPPSVEVWIANPQKQNIDVLMWPCTNFGEGCLEKEAFAEEPQSWISLLENAEEHLTAILPISPLPLAFVPELDEQDLPFKGTALWVLACEQNTCPVIENIKNGTVDLEFLADPFTLMNSLPIEKAALSYRSLYFSNRPENERLQHPIITPSFGGVPNVPLNEFIDLEFSYSLNQNPNEDSRAFAYTTQGGFAPNEDVNNQLLKQTSAVTLRWFAPTTEAWEEERSDKTSYEYNVLDQPKIFVFVEDGFGGLGVWHEQAYLLSSNDSPE